MPVCRAIACYNKYQCEYLDKYRKTALQSLAVQHKVRISFVNGQMVVQGASSKLLGMESIIQTGLGIKAGDWCKASVEVLDKHVLPVPLAQLSFPGQLSEFVLRTMQVQLCLMSAALYTCVPALLSGSGMLLFCLCAQGGLL